MNITKAHAELVAEKIDVARNDLHTALDSLREALRKASDDSPYIDNRALRNIAFTVRSLEELIDDEYVKWTDFADSREV
jgi:heme oxygenase